VILNGLSDHPIVWLLSAVAVAFAVYVALLIVFGAIDRRQIARVTMEITRR